MESTGTDAVKAHTRVTLAECGDSRLSCGAELGTSIRLREPLRGDNVWAVSSVELTRRELMRAFAASRVELTR